MIVVGGVYQERCRFPHWDRIFGSGLRAALALSELVPGIKFHGYVPETLADDVAATLAPFGIVNRLQRSKVAFTFNYLNPFDRLGFVPEEWERSGPLCIEGETDAALRFGLMEGDVVVKARRAVYDPQSPKPTSFSASGSEADELVIVTTAYELLVLADVEPPEVGKPVGTEKIQQALAQLNDTEKGLQAVVLKDGLGGLRLYFGDDLGPPIQTYAAESYFRIGGGDIIAAGLAYAWAQQRLPLDEAADFAARCLAFAVEGPRLPLDAAGVAAVALAPAPPLQKLRIVGGDTLELQVLALHAQSWIKEIGGEVTIDDEIDGQHTTLLLVGEPPRHDVLERLIHAAHNGPCVVYWPNAHLGEVQACFGDVVHTRDFSSALYRAMRMSSR